ncbi:hypothetical protein BTM25_45850 [Actinomadura rubteroloni]|uniref:Uncharacterized protein n=1 Tax=Actinomadura rubteroloni TaxID=1926885 RepID=A0A2P4UEJ3_9ACTN|nr:hypothetical protein [Actinomadura rubteroloni]POM23432.1 hypothetical protein BTM25_45850 [Actinomadura rubteroloni]
MSAARSTPSLLLPGLRDVYAAYARDAERLPALPGALQAEVAVSERLGALEAAAPHRAGRRAALGDLITSLRAAGTSGARVFLLALAAIGPVEGRSAAAKAAASLPGVDVPAWAAVLGQVTPATVWLIQEGPLDGDRLVCEFRYPGGADLHALAVRLGHGDTPAEVVVVGDVPALMNAARQAMQAELCVVQPYPAAEVGRRLRAALDPDGTFPEDAYGALAVARQRAAALPER